MPEWWTYSLRDFVMFSPRTYYRLLELYNAQIWPAQVLALALGVALLVLLRRDDAWRGRAIAALLAGCWLWVAYGYLLERYTTINWAGRYFAAAFALQGILLLVFGVIARRFAFPKPRTPLEHAGLFLFVFAVVFYPLMGPLFGRGWGQAELFGVVPDPTAVGTLGLLLLASERVPWLLLLLPIAWCAMSAATLWVMASPDALLLPASTLLGCGLAMWKTLRVNRR
ncbi:MAG: DUF6064 family protein [Gemmatimonadaceae bacterium]